MDHTHKLGSARVNHTFHAVLGSPIPGGRGKIHGPFEACRAALDSHPGLRLQLNDIDFYTGPGAEDRRLHATVLSRELRRLGMDWLRTKGRVLVFES